MKFDNQKEELSFETLKDIKSVLLREDRIVIFIHLFQTIKNLIPSAIVRGKDGSIIGVSCPGERFIFYICVKDSEYKIKFQGSNVESFFVENEQIYLKSAEEKAIDRIQDPQKYQIGQKKQTKSKEEIVSDTLKSGSEIKETIRTVSLADLEMEDQSFETAQEKNNNSIVFFDLEVDSETKKLYDIGAIRIDPNNIFKNQELRTASRTSLARFVSGSLFVCGHNILAHDLKYVCDDFKASGETHFYIDTLPLSALLFPEKPYHRLVKDDKLQTGELNNPLNDSKLAAKLFYDEVYAYCNLPSELGKIYCSLLHDKDEFSGFFSY